MMFSSKFIEDKHAMMAALRYKLSSAMDEFALEYPDVTTLDVAAAMVDKAHEYLSHENRRDWGKKEILEQGNTKRKKMNDE